MTEQLKPHFLQHSIFLSNTFNHENHFSTHFHKKLSTATYHPQSLTSLSYSSQCTSPNLSQWNSMFFEVQLNFHLQLEVFPWKPNLGQESPLLDDLMGPSCANGTNKDRQQKLKKIWFGIIWFFLKTIKYHMEQNKSFAGLHCTGFIVKHYFMLITKLYIIIYPWVSVGILPYCSRYVRYPL